MRRLTVKNIKRNKMTTLLAAVIGMTAILYGIICLVRRYESILTSLLCSDDGELDDHLVDHF